MVPARSARWFSRDSISSSSRANSALRLAVSSRPAVRISDSCWLRRSASCRAESSAYMAMICASSKADCR